MRYNKQLVMISFLGCLLVASCINMRRNDDFPIRDLTIYGEEINEDRDSDEFTLKLSGYWDENDVTFIHINNDNWSASEVDWIQNATGNKKLLTKLSKLF